MKRNKGIKAFFAMALSACLVLGNVGYMHAEDSASEKKPLTIMYYCDADNDLEPELLGDIEEMKQGVSDEVNLIALVDRHDSYTSDSYILGEDFSDTRLYKINPNQVERLDGKTQFPKISKTSTDFEANMGDANTLKNFIDYCKEEYPADKYALVLSNHGGGPKTNPENETRKLVCIDETDGYDVLYTGEFSDVLTADQSVDLFGLDACLMGSAEFAYQFYKGNGGFEADVMVASAASEWGDGWSYTDILERLQTKEGNNGQRDLTLGGYERYYSPETVTAAEIGAIIVEEQRDSCERVVTDQTLSCYDLSEVRAVKDAVDELAVAIQDEKDMVENLRGDMRNPKMIHYFDSRSRTERVYYPFFDAYDFAKKIVENGAVSKASNSLALSDNNAESVKDAVYSNEKSKPGSDLGFIDIQRKAQRVMDKVDDMVLYSFGQEDYDGFEDGKDGLTIFFPFGDSKVYVNRAWHNHFEFQYWYSPLDLTEYLELGEMCYGKLMWCEDGVDEGINSVGNWFEMLDKWYDETNEVDGGSNGYRW